MSAAILVDEGLSLSALLGTHLVPALRHPKRRPAKSALPWARPFLKSMGCNPICSGPALFNAIERRLGDFSKTSNRERPIEGADRPCGLEIGCHSWL